MIAKSKTYLIIGAGCAGLSLALALAKQKLDCKIVILESEKQFKNKQTWCFWNVQKHPFEQCVSHQWSQWKIKSEGKSLIKESSQYAYQHIPSANFFDYITKELPLYPCIHLEMGVKIQQIDECETHVFVKTESQTWEADFVFDSRPLVPNSDPKLLKQQFHGWTIRTNKPLFNAKCATLMDFFPCNQGVHFFYVLPFSSYEALIESTYFSFDTFSKKQFDQDLQFYLHKNYGEIDYHLIRKESGTLPMQVNYGSNSSLGKKIFPIGTRAGWLKPSTGYGFLAIQKSVNQLTYYLKKNSQLPLCIKQPLSYQYLDQFFLSIITKNYKKAPEIYYHLFNDSQSDQFIRFLGEIASPVEILKIMNCLSKKTILKHLINKLLII